ncbi:hypothetical protein [Mesorhizobium sp. CCNWLY176]|uniref:hypothetical protein n=1 Tax=Mesorhizobium sp. CCNWLY176 TaxID=3128543 RepID=UPI00301E2194
MATIQDIYIPEDINAVRLRFEAFTKKDDASGCWIWKGSITKAGSMRFGWPYPRQTVPATRASVFIYHRDLAAGMDVRSLCHNERCVNPSHLMVCTRAEGMAQLAASGKTLKGMLQPRSRLSDDQVRAIRSAKGTHGDIAAQFKISKRTVEGILQGRSWKHLLPK